MKYNPQIHNRKSPRLKGHDFTQLHPKGTFVLKMSGHITVCKDGVILDTWDCSYRSVYTAWKVEEEITHEN